MERAVKILVVDDDGATLHMLALMLEDALGCEVLTASSARQGLALARQHLPAAIISDRAMEEEDGVVFCQKVRADERLHDVIFILLTASSQVDQRVSGLDAGADDYITKPYHPQELVSRVRAHLRIRALQEKLKEDNTELERVNALLGASSAGVMNLLTHVIGLRVPNAGARSEKARNVALWLAGRLALGPNRTQSLEIAARIHEIGKIIMPDEILRKSAAEKGTEDAEVLAQFPLFGQMLVGGIPQLKASAAILRHQLENFDGTGLPDRLMKEEIPIASRILRVINVIEETSPEGEVNSEALIEALRAARGTVLDPRLVQLTEEYLTTVENANWLDGKHQVAVAELKEGMVIATDLCTASGIKLLPKGARLTASQIAHVSSYHRTDPIINSIYVINQTAA